MVESKKFCTRHESISRENIPKGKNFIIGLDAGKSGIKVFYEKGLHCIPYYCKKLDPLYMGLAREKTIIYRDNSTEEMYMVGRIAQEIFSKMDVENRDDKLLSGKRYYDKQFLVLCQTAIGLSLLQNNDERDFYTDKCEFKVYGIGKRAHGVCAFAKS
ncbi:MAG: hypothetical protein LUF92_11665 [Clostridiales bacterium]|nr:hypothetical protein [Clostridiales bacterium]